MSHSTQHSKPEDAGDSPVDFVVDSGKETTEKFQSEYESTSRDWSGGSLPQDASFKTAQDTVDSHFGDFKLVGLGDNTNLGIANRERDGFGLSETKPLDFRQQFGEREYRAFAAAFNSSPEAVQKLIESYQNGGLSQSEIASRVGEAKGDMGNVASAIGTGAANFNDLGRLLDAYSSLNGFRDGVMMQGAVGAMMDKVRAAINVAAANRDNPSGYSREYLVAHRIKASDLSQLREKS